MKSKLIILVIIVLALAGIIIAKPDHINVTPPAQEQDQKSPGEDEDNLQPKSRHVIKRMLACREVLDPPHYCCMFSVEEIGVETYTEFICMPPPGRRLQKLRRT